jgi:glycosyltransferase involved in cell wall biosynthesis
MNTKRISILIPAFNEAESLVELFIRINAVMSQWGRAYEFLIIDDGSTDDTQQVIAKLHEKYPQVGTIRLRLNVGKSMALMEGFSAATGDIIITMDADLQDEPEDIPRFLDAIDQGYDLVGGWRHKRKDSLAKRFVSNIYNALTEKVCGRQFKDINCGFKAFKKEVADCLDLYGDMHRLIPAIAASFGFQTTEIPVSHKPRKYGESRYKLLRYRGILDLITFTVLRISQVRPFHVMCEMAAGTFLISMALGGFVWGLMYVLEPGIFRYLIRFLFSVLALAFGIITLLLPLFGLVVECVIVNRQNRSWRNQFVASKLLPGNMNEKETI